ncbi:hypothetical protein ACLB2K_053826 [Fragaria x ananassa]
MIRITLVLVVVLILLEHFDHGAKASAETDLNQSELVKPGCSESCGPLVVPYPFGMNPGCYFNDDFFISCNNTITGGGSGGGGGPKAFFRGISDFVILNISLDRQEMRVSRSMSKSCLVVDKNGTVISYSNEEENTQDVKPPNDVFRISSRRNKFTTLGCNLIGFVTTTDVNPSSTTTSGKRMTMEETPTSSLYGLRGYTGSISVDYQACGYAFVTEAEEFKFSSLDLIQDVDNRKAAPLVLEWAIRNHLTCGEARRNRSDYACKAKYSDCVNSTNGPGYICKCRKGYQGNPYLLHGCQDIDECASEKLNPCSSSATCINNSGGVTCNCSEGFIGDGKEAGTGCYRSLSRQLKLLIVALETEVPVLVYEFITNGTLASHLHANRSLNQSLPTTLTLQMRLKIAAEIAGALAYLHSETCMPIIHRDVKTSNILLDDNFTAKVADFGASRLIPLGQTQLTTLLQGTIGYLDPEFLYSSELTDKSDVSSFGVILTELLTGKTPLIFDEGRKSTVNLAVYFVSCVEEECLHKILDDQAAMEDEVFEVVKQVAGVAVIYVFKDKKGGTTYHEGSCSRARSFVQNVILLIKNIT